MSRARRSAWPSARRWLFGVVGLLLLLVMAYRLGWMGDAWRVAYPHLPARVQGIPYRLRAALPGADATPVALPPPQAHTAIGIGATEATPLSETAATGARPTSTRASRTVPPTPAPSATATVALPDAVQLSELRHSYQTWNNCGPATVDMALSAWQVPGDQAQAAVRLKPDPDDKNVSPEELSRYAVERGLEAPVLHGGSLATLERLVSMGIPVILETWFVPDPGDEMGHYRLLVGYRDGGSTLLFYDSYLGPDLAVPAAEVDRDWRAFNRLYVPVYPPERGPEVRAAVGPGFDDAQSMWTLAAAAAQAETLSLDDAFAHFNLGTSLAGLGDMASAAAAFDRARERGLPWRMLWYQHAPFAVYAALDRWADVAALADANLRNAPNLEESLLWRAAAADATQARPQAIEDVARALRLNPLYAPAAAAQAAIEAGEPIGQALVNAGAGLPARALSPSPSQADGADAP